MARRSADLDAPVLTHGTLFYGKPKKITAGICRGIAKALKGELKLMLDEKRALIGGLRFQDSEALFTHMTNPFSIELIDKTDLEMTIRQCDWSEAVDKLRDHTAATRLTLVRGPEEPLRRLVQFTRLVRVFSHAGGAIAYHHTAGLLMHPPSEIERAWEELRNKGVPLWFWIGAQVWRDEGECVVNTSGMHQLELPALESRFDPEKHDPGQMRGYVLALAEYIATKGEVIQPGHTVDGPDGGKWECTVGQSSVGLGEVLRFDAPGATPPPPAPPPKEDKPIPTPKPRRRRR